MLLAAVLCLPAAHGAGRTIVVVGDSLSSGYGMAAEQSWVALLKERLAGEGYGYAVVNASIAGDTSAGGLSRLPRLLMTHMPAVVVIELGGNDAAILLKDAIIDDEHLDRRESSEPGERSE